jgi:hypothetical protein
MNLITFGCSKKKKKRRKYLCNHSGEDKQQEDLIRRNSIKDKFKWPEYFEKFRTAHFTIIATVTFSTIYFYLIYKPLNISEADNHFTQNHYSKHQLQSYALCNQ